tara:strand:+ start:100 stop:387 length:288 start_codon:yes stop_codon:yes gene_type:complete
MKDKSLITLKYTVIFLNIILILGFIIFAVFLTKKLTKSTSCKDSVHIVDNLDNVLVEFSQEHMFVIEKYTKKLYVSTYDNCRGELINKIELRNAK